MILSYKKYCEIKKAGATEAEYEAYLRFSERFCDPAENFWQQITPLYGREVSVVAYSAFIAGYAAAKGRLDEMLAAAEEVRCHTGRPR